MSDGSPQPDSGQDRRTRQHSVEEMYEKFAQLNQKVDRIDTDIQEQLAEIQNAIAETWAEHEKLQDDRIRQLADATGVQFTLGHQEPHR